MARNRDYLKIPGCIVHVYNRGIDRSPLFPGPRFYDKFMELLALADTRSTARLLCYTLMPNELHLILQQLQVYGISRFMYDVCRPFALLMNKRLKRSGPRFDSRYKGDVIDDPAGFLRMSGSIHAIPVEARLVKKVGEWRYSSCRSYLDGREKTLARRDLLWRLVGGPDKYAKFLEEFDPADPPAAEMFLCSEAATIWERGGVHTGKRAVRRSTTR